VNSVAALLLDRSPVRRTTEDALNTLGASLLFGDGAARLLAPLRASHARAVAASDSVRIPSAAAYLDQVGRNIAQLATMLHRARVEARFGPRLSRRRAPWAIIST